MKKKVIIITSIILTILAVAASSVYALWYISVNRKINPQDVTEDVVEAYIKDECNKTYTYGGGASLTSSPNAQLPLSSKLDNSQLTYSYKLSTDTTYSNANFNASNNTVSNGPIDAGTYDIKVSYNKTTTNEDGTSKTEVITISNISFSITPKELDISSLTPTNSSNLVYNGTSLTPTYDISSLLYEIDRNDVSLTATSTNTVDANVEHTATLSLSGDNASNYSLGNNTKTFTISPKPITLSWDAYSNLTYKGSEHTILCEFEGLVETDNITPTLTYYKDGTNTSNTTKCTYAGSYRVEGSLPSSATNYVLTGDNYIEFVVAKKDLHIGSTTLEYNYDSTNRGWAYFKTYLANNIPTTILDGLCSTDEANIQVIAMNDGTFGYGNDASTYNEVSNGYYMGFTSTYLNTYVIGSTYIVSLDIDNLFSVENVKNSYNIIKDGTILFKYKTALVGSTYYTIEDAINNTSGNIILQGDGPSNNTYAATTFSNILSTKTYMLNGRTILVPYQNTTNASNFKDDGSSDSDVNSSKISAAAVYSSLTIPNGITLDLYSGSYLVASAYIASTGGTKSTNVCDRGVIFNAGTININNSNIYAYGYVKGTGLINLNSGSAIDCMTTYDWPGGADAIGIYSKVLLTNGWSMHNISCKTNIYSGATYNGFIYVLIPTFSTQCQATAVVLGNASSNNCIFRTKSGYLIKSTTKADAWSNTHASYLALFSNVGSNQINGQRDVFELYGEFEDATLEINMKYNFIGERDIQLKTDTSKPATIGFMDIYIREGSTLKLANSDYAFLPGSTVQIDSRAKVEINNSNVDITIFSNDYFTSNADLKATSGSAAYYRICVDKKDAEFIVNGELNCNGKIGGYINTTADGAIMIIGSTASVTANYVLMANNGGAKASSGSLTATANVGGTVTNIDKGTSGQAYVSVNNNGTYYWTLADNANKFYINLYDSDKETQLGDTLTLYSLDDTKEIPANINEPSKDFYNFVTWLNEDGTTFNGTVMSPGETITLYASWEEIEYSIEYSASEVDIDGNVLNTITDSVTFPQRTTFTISDFVDGRLDLSTATYSNYYFDGWYAGYDKTIANKFPYLTTEMLSTLSNTFGETIPLYCEFCETRKYTIQFNIVGNSDMTIISDYQTTESSITLSSIEQVVKAQTIYDSYNKDTAYSKYFMGWYIEGNAFGINDTISLIDFADTDGNLVITVNWGNKYTVTITNGNTSRVEEITMTDTDGITYANNTYIVPGTKFKVYVKFSWLCAGTRTATITVGDWSASIETSYKFTGGYYEGTYDDGLTANGNVTVYATY